jgi:hypothetical protein
VGAVSRSATYTVTVRGTGIHGFRRWLKAGLRSYGLKVIDAYEHTTPKVSRCRTAPAVRTTQARRGDKTMDMRKYSGSAFLKPDDVGPAHFGRRSSISRKYGKPDLEFDDGTKLGVNSTRNRTLVNAYGGESDDWLNKEIELSVGEVEYEGKMLESIIVKPISPPIKKKPKPKPKDESGANGKHGDMDDEIPF